MSDLQLIPVPVTHIDFAWRAGAHLLDESVKLAGGDYTIDQLKYLLIKGERSLVELRRGDNHCGWACLQVQQKPNKRIMFVTDLVAHNQHFEEFMGVLKPMAISQGCSSIRCSAKRPQARLYRQKLNFKSLYEILEVEI